LFSLVAPYDGSDRRCSAMSSISSSSLATGSVLTEGMRRREGRLGGSKLGVRQGAPARTGTRNWDPGDQFGEEAPEGIVVVLQDPDHLLGCDGGNTLDADVVVGDERDVEAAQLQLPGEDHLGVLGHADDVPPLRCVESTLGP